MNSSQTRSSVTPSPVVVACLGVIVALAASTVVCAVGWTNSMAPRATEVGNVATWVGAVGTILGLWAAVVTIWHSNAARRQAETDERLSQARRVAVTSHMKIEPAAAPWKVHQDAWTEPRAVENHPSIEEEKYLESYDGPFSGTVSFTVQNGSPYALFEPIAVVHSPIPSATENQLPVKKRIPLAVVLPGGTCTGTTSFELSAKPADSQTIDLVEFEFSDVWRDRWRSTRSGTQKIQ